MTAVDPEGRIRHPLDVFHATLMPDGSFVPAGYMPAADGAGLVDYVDPSTIGGGASPSDTAIWRPLSDGAGGVIYDAGTGDIIMAFGPV